MPLAILFASRPRSGTVRSTPDQPILVGLATYRQWASLSVGGPFAGVAELSDGLELILGT